MKTIWKYELRITDQQAIGVPYDAEILSVQMQGNALCLWALVDSGDRLQSRHIFIAGTGNPFPKGEFKHLGTVQDGALVWHVFEEFPA